jgi:hypothetical protein
MSSKRNERSDSGTEISKFVLKSVVDFSEIISDDSETQEKIQAVIFAVTGAIGGVLFYSRIKDKDSKQNYRNPPSR